MQEKVFDPLKNKLLLLFFSMVLFITGCTNISTRERIEGVWIIPGENVIFSLSSAYSTKGFYQTYYLRRIDPISGKIVNSNSIKFKYNYSVHLLYCTNTSLWIQHENEFTCLYYPSLKKKWNNAEFYKQIKQKHPEIGEPFSCKLFLDKFEITNKAGKTFLIGRDEFEDTKPADIFYFDEYGELGKRNGYTTPEDRFFLPKPIKIEVEEVGNEKKHDWKKMNIYTKLLADTGYARNYAIFTPDSSCYFFDGNHSRVIQKLRSDSLELIWKPAFDGRDWLEGDFLRPYKGYRDLPNSRIITTQNNIAFIHYQTSLDKKENKLKLAGVDLKTEKVLWDIDLTLGKIVDDNRPVQSEVISNILIVLWLNADKSPVLTGIDIATGEVKWSIRK